MMKLEIVAILLFIVWNSAVFFIYGLDKRKAILGKRRIREKTLICMAIFMGGSGAFLGMNIFHHKTRHMKFRIGVPLAMILNIGIVALGVYCGTEFWK